jgi:hypothetical protein
MTTVTTTHDPIDLGLAQALWDLQDHYRPEAIALTAVRIAIETAADDADNDALSALLEFGLDYERAGSTK